MAKFERFYYSEDNKIHYLHDLISLPENDCLKLYKNKMFCPFCHAVPLAKVVRKQTFLRGFPNHVHPITNGKTCLGSVDEAPKRVIKEYLNQLNDSQIHGRLQSTLRYLLRNSFLRSNLITQAGIDIDLNETLLVVPRKGEQPTKAIPRYSFNGWGENTPQDTLLIAYGNLYAITVDSYIRLYSNEGGRLITSFKINDGTLDLEDGNYNIVCIGYCEPYTKNDRIYYNFKLYKHNSFVIEPINQ